MNDSKPGNCAFAEADSFPRPVIMNIENFSAGSAESINAFSKKQLNFPGLFPIIMAMAENTKSITAEPGLLRKGKSHGKSQDNCTEGICIAG